MLPWKEWDAASGYFISGKSDLRQRAARSVASENPALWEQRRHGWPLPAETFHPFLNTVRVFFVPFMSSPQPERQMFSQYSRVVMNRSLGKADFLGYNASCTAPWLCDLGELLSSLCASDPPCVNEDNGNYLLGWLGGLNEWMHVKCAKLPPQQEQCHLLRKPASQRHPARCVHITTALICSAEKAR